VGATPTSATTGLPDVIVNAEDRSSEEDALKILVLSILKHYPDPPPIHLICPNATPAFERWARSRSGVVLSREPLEQAAGFNVKPQAFERLFNLGYQKVLWLDNDVVLGPSFEEKTRDRRASPCLVCEEPRISQHPAPQALTLALGLDVGRALPRVINTGALSIAAAHRALVSAWKEVLLSDAYRAAQAQPWHERPAHFLGDQEVLTALLGSKAFADIPVAYLREGDDIIQMFGPAGYAPGDRLRNASRGLPALVHSMGHKPWRPDVVGNRSKLRGRYDDLHGELSPYAYVARDVVGDNREEFPWLFRRSVIGGAMRAISFDNPALAGFPLALFDSAVRRAKRLLNIDRMKTG
jgi:hypothetical protein